MKSVSAVDVKKILDSGEKVILLDVRSQPEFSGSRIRSAINLPYEEIEEKVEAVARDKKSRIIVYCLSGSRSMIAAGTLEKLGYTDIYNMENGLLGWRANGFATE